MSTRTAAWGAWISLSLSLILVVLSLVFQILNLSGLQHLRVYDVSPASVAFSVLFPMIGALIVVRQPENWIGWIFCASGGLAALEIFATQYGIYALFTSHGRIPLGTEFAWLRGWIWLPSFNLIALLLMLFPTGHLPSPRWRWVGWLVGGSNVLYILLAIQSWGSRELRPFTPPTTEEARQDLIGTVAILLLCINIVLSAIVLLLRWRHAVGVERQQLKWVAYAGMLFAVGLIGIQFLESENTLLEILREAFAVALVASLPLAVGIAILKYRLYDIDVIINRTLVYGTLTVLLTGVFISLVVALREVVEIFTGQQESQLAIVASTLAIAALFNPLRRRIQAFIDRRFYRRKYDAAQVLASFSARLRDEVDLDTLRDDLTTVVEETLQPAHVSLWLQTMPPGRPAADEVRSP